MDTLVAQENNVEQAASTRTPVPVLDQTAWAAKAFYFDILALSVLLLSALGLGMGFYVTGYLAGWGGAQPANPSFHIQARLGVGLIAFAASFTWIAARLIRAGYRALPGHR